MTTKKACVNRIRYEQVENAVVDMLMGNVMLGRYYATVGVSGVMYLCLNWMV
ncbi:hypothetical protein BS17DRAFT_776055 [Gyrodon lividus]|nr:hypothetical protein BS17DRAFT_776055 [Gyrodon lividus]